MARDDSLLYTGITSASEPKLTPRKAQAEQKEKTRRNLKPAVEEILDLIGVERADIVNLKSFVLDRTTPEEEIKVELLARKMYHGYLNSLEAKVKNIMAVKEPKKRPIDE